MISLDEQKAAARTAARARRTGLDPALAGAALTEHVLRAIALPPIVVGFWPMGDEIDIRPLLAALHARGHRVGLPATPRRGLPLTFHAWHPGAAMIPERFGTMRPDGPEVVPDAVLVPLLAFDPACHRLGYGGGFYDRTLAGLPGRPKIGCAFAAQRVDAVPVGPYDVPLDAVATDQGIVRPQGPNAHTLLG
jgi:5-formyltetrahydrofolate cyclo-ligase